MNVVITYCSKKKARPDVLKLRALERYAGSHIRLAAEFAHTHNRPLFFLSGWLGLVASDAEIIHYDYYLAEPNTDLTNQVADQIFNRGITDIFYYTEQNEKTAPYDRTLTNAVAVLDVMRHYKCALHTYIPDSSDHFHVTETATPTHEHIWRIGTISEFPIGFVGCECGALKPFDPLAPLDNQVDEPADT